MEILSSKWISDELEMNDALSNFMCDQYNMDHCTLDYSIDNHNDDNDENNKYTSNSVLSNRTSSTVHHHQPNYTTTKFPVPNPTAVTSSSAALICFNNSNSNTMALVPCSDEKNYYIGSSYDDDKNCNNKVEGDQRTSINGRSPLHARDHVIAERKRREKLNQKFIALSAVVPGLKKMDKASVLGNAISYVKQLEERVKTLEEEHEMKTKNHESVIMIKKSLVVSTAVEEDSSSHHDDQDYYSCGNLFFPLPEIEARVLNKEVLIRIYCEKQYGGCNLANLLAKIENLHLTILNATELPLGTSTIDITIVAQVINYLTRNLLCYLTYPKNLNH
ncbi:hypothetical protein F8388_005112 [Cannabis sativa]|uniref:BHLH domain-containing protein n=1 Tax=Cannabis sativa TaxID=3483 RepID=A0A7J6DUV9_CANSA|nr:hypothetical protein F8388_005112 [Cannabis sativa]KAF4402125.1 hypothetical protein G4B88_017637 [Cannabis sativa]